MSEIGLLLPIGKDPFSPEQLQWLSELDGCGLESVWVRDLPLVDLDDGDLGSGYDPMVFLADLSHRMPTTKLGSAVVGTAFRDPMITAKGVASLQSLSRDRFLFGLGPGEKKNVLSGFGVDKDRRRSLFIDAYTAVRTLLFESASREDSFGILPQSTSMALGPGFSPPPMHIATSDEEVWRSIDGNAEGWMTWFRTPHKLAEERERVIVRSGIPSLQVTMTLNLIFSDDVLASPREVKIGGLSGLEVGARNLGALVSTYTKLGVDRLLVSLPSPTNPVEEVERLVESRHVSSMSY